MPCSAAFIAVTASLAAAAWVSRSALPARAPARSTAPTAAASRILARAARFIAILAVARRTARLTGFLTTRRFAAAGRRAVRAPLPGITRGRQMTARSLLPFFPATRFFGLTFTFVPGMIFTRPGHEAFAK